MPVFEVKVVIALSVHADSEEEAKILGAKRVVFERKQITHQWLSVESAKQSSMF